LPILWRKNATRIAIEHNLDVRIANSFCAMLELLLQTKWKGACHGTSTMFYVLLRELGYDANLCSGVISTNFWVTGHSWVELKGKVYDAACYFSAEDTPHLMPVFNGMSLDTMQATETAYGIADAPFDAGVHMMVNDSTVSNTMAADYVELKGISLWQALDNVCMLSGIEILKVTNGVLDVRDLRDKYKDVRSELRDHISIPITHYVDLRPNDSSRLTRMTK